MFPDDFAGARIVDDTRGWIAFRDDPPQAAMELIAAFGRQVEVIGGRGFSEADLDRRLIETHTEAMSLGILEDVSSGYDTQTGSIRVEVVPVEGVSLEEAREAADRLEGQFGGGSTKVEVVVLER